MMAIVLSILWFVYDNPMGFSRQETIKSGLHYMPMHKTQKPWIFLWPDLMSLNMEVPCGPHGL